MKKPIRQSTVLTVGLLALAGCGGAKAAGLDPSQVTLGSDPPGFTQETINPEATYLTTTTTTVPPTSVVITTTTVPPTSVIVTTTTAPPPPPLPSDVLFDPKSADLKVDPSAFLDPVVAVLQQRPELRLQIIGYTDSDGTPAYNADLSLRRADAVKTWLVSKGIAPNRLSTTGMGEANPIGDNTTVDGKLKNRRVELQYL